jgi:hypothetical protein
MWPNIVSGPNMGESHTLLRAPFARRMGSTSNQRGVCDQRKGFYVDDYVYNWKLKFEIVYNNTELTATLSGRPLIEPSSTLWRC